MSYVGWDWASRTHDVTVLDNDGHRQARWAFEHTESGWTSTLQRLRRYGEPHELPVIIERRELLARNPIRGTATSWPTTCAPTGTDCASWSPSNLDCESCRLWCGFAMTRSAPGLRQPTNSPLPLTRIGPDREIYSAPWHHRSRWRSWPITRPRKRPRIWVRSAWVRSAVGMPTAAANPQRS